MTAEQPATLDAIIEGLGFGPFQWRVTAVMAVTVAAEAVELYTISYVLPFAACSWGLSALQTASLSTAFFLGLIVGNYTWGTLADLVGRQRCLIFAGAVVFYFSVLSTFSPNYLWFGALRAAVGFAIAGLVGTAYPLYMELTPSSHRHFLFLIHPVVGAAGCILLYCLGSAIIPLHGWRVLVATATLPGLLALSLAIFLLPRSPRFLLLMGDQAEAERVLARISKLNNRPLPKLSDDAGPTRDCPKEWGFARMFCPSQLRLTAAMLLVWLSAGFLHYAGMLLGLVLPSVYLQRCSASVFPPLDTGVDHSCACDAALGVYLSPLIGGALGEAASLLFPGVLARFAGRRVALFASAVAAAALTPLHAVCKSPVGMGAVLLFQRAATLGLFLTCVLYTTEAFPTSGRAAALGLGSAVNRVGNLLAPFLVNVPLASRSLWSVLGGMVGVGLFAGLLVLLLPFETKDRALYETFRESERAQAEARKNYRTFDKGK